MSMPHPTLESGRAGRGGLVEGLATRPLTIPSKFFYDDRGSDLFDAICDLPEYYPTRTEQALLSQVSNNIATRTGARQLVELGAGMARKTRHLIRAHLELNQELHYLPLDISPHSLDQAEALLSQEFPGLNITGIQCDYTEDLDGLETGPGCLAIFLGSSIGNFTHAEGVALLQRLRARIAVGSWLLLGVDLVKPVKILEAAYNDSAGVTADFNKNILEVVNREVGGDFEPNDFRHLAIFNEKASQVEMYLVARHAVGVRLEALDLDLAIASGERIRTEISRKFTRESTADLLTGAGFQLTDWLRSEDGYVALALSRVGGDR